MSTRVKLTSFKKFLVHWPLGSSPCCRWDFHASFDTFEMPKISKSTASYRLNRISAVGVALLENHNHLNWSQRTRNLDDISLFSSCHFSQLPFIKCRRAKFDQVELLFVFSYQKEIDSRWFWMSKKYFFDRELYSKVLEYTLLL